MATRFHTGTYGSGSFENPTQPLRGGDLTYIKPATIAKIAPPPDERFSVFISKNNSVVRAGSNQ